MNSCMPLALPVISCRKSPSPMRMVTRGLSALPCSTSQVPSAIRMAHSWVPSGALISYWTVACWPAALAGLKESAMPANTCPRTPLTPPSCCWMAATSSSLDFCSTAALSAERSEASMVMKEASLLGGGRGLATVGCSLPVVDAGVAAQLGELVAGVDLAGGAGLGAHRQRLGEGAAAVEAHAPQQLAVGHAGGGEEHVLAPDQVVDGQHLVEVVALVEGGPALVVVARPQPAEHGRVQALERAGGDHRLRRAADPHQQVDAGALARGHDRPGDVPVGDELDAGAGRADLPDQLLVAGAVEDADGQVGDVGALGPGDSAQVVGQRS